jgi:hypothetical protein
LARQDWRSRFVFVTICDNDPVLVDSLAGSRSKLKLTDSSDQRAIPEKPGEMFMRDGVRSAAALVAGLALIMSAVALSQTAVQAQAQTRPPLPGKGGMPSGPGAPAAPAPAPAATPAPAPQQVPPLQQIELTEKQIASLLAAQKEMDAITDKLPASPTDKPDPKVQAQLEAIAKKNGFADINDYGLVYDNVSFVMTGIDPKTKAFIQPSEALKKQIAAVQADAKIPARDKKAILDDMNATLATAEAVKFPGNVTLVTKYYDQLAALMQDDE